MPYLRITSQQLPSAQRHQVAGRLTAAFNDLLFDPRSRLTRDELRERTTIHFTPYAPDELFVGGRTTEERLSPDITLELSDWDMSRRQRRRLAHAPTSELADLFPVPRGSWDNINIRFHPPRTAASNERPCARNFR